MLTRMEDRETSSDKQLLSQDFVSLIPNALTVLRLLLIPVMVVAMARGREGIGLSLFVVAAVTDFVDGYVARRYGAVSDIGKLLDPLADKILVMAALVMLVGLRSPTYGEPWVPAWLVVLVLAREFWVTGLRGVAASRGIVLPASSTGKWKSALQMFAVVLLLLHDTPFPLFILPYQLSCQLVGVNFLFLSIAFSYWGAVEYTLDVLGELRSSD